MNREKERSVVSIGTTSLVLIFVMLCLLTFSVLSLVTARADINLARRNAERTTAYYEAENQANDILFSVIACLDHSAHATNAGTAYADDADDVFYRRVRQYLEGTDGISFTDDRTLEYEVPLEEEQVLHVTLEISHERYEDGAFYRILEWCTVSSHEWESDETLPLL